MSIRIGLNSKIYRNTGTFASPTWDEVANVKDLALDLSVNEADAATRGNGGWNAIVPTLKEAEVTWEMAWDPDDADLEAFRAAFIAGSTIEVAVLDGTIGNTPADAHGLRFEAAVTKFSRAEPLAGINSVSVAIKPTYTTNGGPSWVTL